MRGNQTIARTLSGVCAIHQIARMSRDKSFTSLVIRNYKSMTSPTGKRRDKTFTWVAIRLCKRLTTQQKDTPRVIVDRKLSPTEKSSIHRGFLTF